MPNKNIDNAYTTLSHLIMEGPGVYTVGSPINETITVAEGKQRRRKLTADSVVVNGRTVRKSMPQDLTQPRTPRDFVLKIGNGGSWANITKERSN